MLKKFKLSKSPAKSLLRDNVSIKNAAAIIRHSECKTVAIVNEDGVLVGTLSDGDIRRHIINEGRLEDLVEHAVNPKPITVGQETINQTDVLLGKISSDCSLLPIISDDQKVVGLLERKRSVGEDLAKTPLFLMAGGRGVRLRPYTDDCPKPLLSVGGRPILEHSIIEAYRQGFREIIISLNYLGPQIKDYFKDGRDFGVKIKYVHEKEPLGTAGALHLLERDLARNFVVMNGDLITSLDFRCLLSFHIEQASQATIVVQRHEMVNPYGVVETNGFDVCDLYEKPVIQQQVNAGVYVITEAVRQNICHGGPTDMPDLLKKIQSAGGKLKAFPLFEGWMDIGTPEDLIKARAIYNEG